MLSDEKISHLVHLLLEGLEKEQMIQITNRETALREAKRVCTKYIVHLSDSEESARQRIKSQKNAPPDGSSQWNALFQKYYEEELRKRGR